MCHLSPYPPCPPFPWEKGGTIREKRWHVQFLIIRAFKLQGSGLWWRLRCEYVWGEPEGLLKTGFPFGVSTHQPLGRE